MEVEDEVEKIETDEERDIRILNAHKRRGCGYVYLLCTNTKCGATDRVHAFVEETYGPITSCTTCGNGQRMTLQAMLQQNRGMVQVQEEEWRVAKAKWMMHTHGSGIRRPGGGGGGGGGGVMHGSLSGKIQNH